MMNSRPAKLFIVIATCAAVAYGVPVGAQPLKKEPDANQLSCGQKVLVENNTCPAVKFCKLPGAASARHPGLMWCKLKKERNTIASSEPAR